MEIFEKDLFSSGHRSLSVPSASVSQEVADTLGRDYGLFLEGSDSVKEFGGLGVNSKNFRLATSQGDFVFKKNLKQFSEHEYETQLAVANETGLHGFAMPAVRQTKSGRLIAFGSEGCFWTLSDFFEGDHFTGSSSQMESVAEKLVFFHEALVSAPSAENLPVFESAEKNASAHDTFQSVFELEDRLDQYFPPTDCTALKAHSGLLRRALELSRSFTCGRRFTCAPTHIDLHPHNLLVAANGEVAILDYDAVFVTDRAQFMSYSALKLLRQVACTKGRQAAVAGLDLLFGMKLLSDRTQSGAAAVTEVLRRIALILDLNLRKGNREWNSVLGMLLCNLREAIVIFRL